MSEKTPTGPASAETRGRTVTQADMVVALALACTFIVCVAIMAYRNHRLGNDIHVVHSDTAAVPYRVNLNHATIQELMLLPGIGRVRAERIATWRQTHGLFQSLDDVRKAAGISEKTLGQLTELVTLENAARYPEDP